VIHGPQSCIARGSTSANQNRHELHDFWGKIAIKFLCEKLPETARLFFNGNFGGNNMTKRSANCKQFNTPSHTHSLLHTRHETINPLRRAVMGAGFSLGQQPLLPPEWNLTQEEYDLFTSILAECESLAEAFALLIVPEYAAAVFQWLERLWGATPAKLQYICRLCLSILYQKKAGSRPSTAPAHWPGKTGPALACGFSVDASKRCVCP
jgi:hypothetical protein